MSSELLSFSPGFRTDTESTLVPLHRWRRMKIQASHAGPKYCLIPPWAGVATVGTRLPTTLRAVSSLLSTLHAGLVTLINYKQTRNFSQVQYEVSDK
jgi:hypothetical protein